MNFTPPPRIPLRPWRERGPRSNHPEMGEGRTQ